MRRFHLAMITVAAVLLGAGAGVAADLEIPTPPAPDVSVHRGPPNCSQWTDECVNCSRGADGDAVCSNIGIACQPRAVRCLRPLVPQHQPEK